jgi:hypothetical protein
MLVNHIEKMGVSLLEPEKNYSGDIEEMMSLSLYAHLYYIIYALTFAYIVKLLLQNGLPKLMVENITNQDDTSVPNFYLGTRELGMGLFYYINITDRRFAIKFMVQKVEGKMILMALCFPFSLFLTILSGIAVDCGKITWNMECNEAIDIFTRVLHLLGAS